MVFEPVQPLSNEHSVRPQSSLHHAAETPPPPSAPCVLGHGCFRESGSPARSLRIPRSLRAVMSLRGGLCPVQWQASLASMVTARFSRAEALDVRDAEHIFEGGSPSSSSRPCYAQLRSCHSTSLSSSGPLEVSKLFVTAATATGRFT
jgi:hypothetical protein